MCSGKEMVDYIADYLENIRYVLIVNDSFYEPFHPQREAGVPWCEAWLPEGTGPRQGTRHGGGLGLHLRWCGEVQH